MDPNVANLDYRIAADHPSLPGQYPGRPVVPAVVLLERVLEAIETAGGVELGALRLPQIKFLRPLLPEQTARIEVRAQDGHWRFRIVRGDETIASGEVAAA